MASGTSVVTGLAFLVSSQLGAARLGQLVSLHIDTCKQLRDEQLGQALGLCPALRSLSLINCGKLTGAAALHIRGGGSSLGMGISPEV
ncbi:hypothetical protein HaLaN_06237 [Haematococcus lacustris]|uniref:Uncharacterized protein n=1 Tax=Haematococcus lacustris TaxID=44745 RepID=A0A699YVK0_HAELA|nr:hypothetical protein HaLaN_06237 [Haematococcus lacustris]